MELVKAEQGKGTSSTPKVVENGNQGLTAEEIMQKKREEFFRKRAGAPAEKVRWEMTLNIDVSGYDFGKPPKSNDIHFTVSPSSHPFIFYLLSRSEKRVLRKHIFQFPRYLWGIEIEPCGTSRKSASHWFIMTYWCHKMATQRHIKMKLLTSRQRCSLASNYISNLSTKPVNRWVFFSI